MSQKQLTPEEHDKIMIEIAALINSAYPPYNGVPMSDQDADPLAELGDSEFDPGSGEAVALELDNEGEATDKISVEIGMDGDQVISCEDLDALANGSSSTDGGAADAIGTPHSHLQSPARDTITVAELEADANSNDTVVSGADLLSDANAGGLSGKITIRDLLAYVNEPSNLLSVTAEDLDAIVADVVKAISKREDVKPKEGVQKYGKVTFADPTNKKYPIDTEEHIRAAWNYINKEKNAAKYSGGEVSAIKRRIVSAWKAKIDKEGPPSVQKKDIDFESDSVLIYDGDWSEVKDMGEGKIGGYAIRFSTKSDPDLVLDYFDKTESNIEYPHSDMPEVDNDFSEITVSLGSAGIGVRDSSPTTQVLIRFTPLPRGSRSTMCGSAPVE